MVRFSCLEHLPCQVEFFLAGRCVRGGLAKASLFGPEHWPRAKPAEPVVTQRPWGWACFCAALLHNSICLRCKPWFCWGGSMPPSWPPCGATKTSYGPRAVGFFSLGCVCRCLHRLRLTGQKVWVCSGPAQLLRIWRLWEWATSCQTCSVGFTSPTLQSFIFEGRIYESQSAPTRDMVKGMHVSKQQ